MPVTLALVAAAAGVASAVFQASLLTGSVSAFLLAYLAQLPLFMVGLSLGVSASAIAATVATALLAAFGGIVFAVTFAAVNAAPAVLVTRQALLSRSATDGTLEWYPATNLLICLIGTAALLFLAIVAGFGILSNGLQASLQPQVQAILDEMVKRDWAVPEAAELGPMITLVLPGITALSWLTMNIVNGVLAQGALGALGRKLRPAPDIRTIELPRWLHAAAAVCGLGILFGGNAAFVGINLLLMFALAYFFQGMAVIHTIVSSWNQKYLWLTATYIILFVIMWPAAVLVVLVGAIEPWAQLRRRFAALPSPWR